MPNDPQLEALKVPPHSMEAEQSVLGGLLLENGASDRVADIVGGEDFYSDAHRLLYKAIMDLIADNKPADVVTVGEALGLAEEARLHRRHGVSRRAGGKRAHGGQHPPLRRNRARARDPAPAGRSRRRDRRQRLSSARAQRARNSRPRRNQGVRDRGTRRARTAGFPGNPSAPDAGRRAHRVPLQPRQSLGRDRRRDRIHRPRSHDLGIPGRRPDRDRGPAEHGEDVARAEHR